MRDFSALDTTVNSKWKGKYLAFEQEWAPSLSCHRAIFSLFYYVLLYMFDLIFIWVCGKLMWARLGNSWTIQMQFEAGGWMWLHYLYLFITSFDPMLHGSQRLYRVHFHSTLHFHQFGQVDTFENNAFLVGAIISI